ncbi:MAG: transposase [Chloroflexi bacterium]|nr:transposase [Chloroflexota bacterium]
MARDRMDLRDWLSKQLEASDTDLLREMVGAFVDRLMGAEVNAVCGAGYRERTDGRTNYRNGYRERAFDTRVGDLPPVSRPVVVSD